MGTESSSRYFVDRVEEEKIVYNGLDVMVIGGFNNIEGFEIPNPTGLHFTLFIGEVLIDKFHEFLP
ncbi:MAG: hypothetical protein LZ174_10680 [Thaumarchaeota archaeon]|jgi:hypothetical protein|nr:hypothetical protein [Candidatus Geocrenenecus arthurdayi]